MKEGVRAVRAHAALSVCLMLAALAVAGGGVYAVLGGDAETGGEGGPVSTVTAPEIPTTAVTVAQGTQQWFRDTAEANGIPLPETARAEAVATPPSTSPSAMVPETVVDEETPAVMPVHLPASSMDVQQLEQVLPGLHIPPQARAQVQAQLGALAGVTVGITTAAVNQGTEETTDETAQSRVAQKDAGEGEQGLGIDLAEDFDTVIAVLDPGEDSGCFDLNGFSIDENGNVQICAGNRIPDRAELMIVEQVLNTPGIDFSAVGGVSHAAAVARWQMILNSFCAEGDPFVPLTAGQRESFMRVAAGYCMLGDPASVIGAVMIAALNGWGVADEATVRSLFAPMPWPFSVGGNFTGSVGKSNYAKQIIAWVTAHEACLQEAPPCEQPTFNEVFAVSRGMLDGTINQETLLAGIQAPYPQPLFPTVTVQVAGQFLAPTVGRWDCRASEDTAFVAVPDTALHFDHWEVTPDVGTPYTSPEQTLDLGNVTGNMTVRAVARHDPATPIDFAFTDRRMEQAVRAAAHKMTGSLLWGDVEELIMLEARGLGITSLDGLQYLTGLLLLDLRDNHITDLTPLGSLTGLKWLLLGHNDLVQSSDPGQTHPLSPLAGMAPLELLDLGWGFAGFEQYLWESLGQANHLTNAAPLASLNFLANLDLCGNDLDSLEGLSGKASLQWLFLDDNTGLWTPEGNSGHCEQNQAILASLGGLGVLMAQNTGLTDDTLSGMLTTGSSPRRLPALAVIGLCGNRAITTLGPLNGYTGLHGVLCGDNPNLCNISALAGKTDLEFVRLVNTGISTLYPLTCGTLHDGLLTARNNPALVGALGNSPCEMGGALLNTACDEVSNIESHNNTVDRDFVCGSEVLLTLSVYPPNAGSTIPSPGAYPVQPGTTAILQAVQTDPNHLFSHWTGHAAYPSSSITVVYVDRSRAMTAVFAPDGDCTLTMLPPATCVMENGGCIVQSSEIAPGTVSPGPFTWHCRTGETRHLHAEPAAGWAFAWWARWNGQYQTFSTSPDYDLKMTGNEVVVAAFQPATRMLHMQGVLIGDRTTPGPGYSYYADGQQVQLHAEAYPGHCFQEWQYGPASQSGFSATATDTTLIMDQDYAIRPRFVPCGQAPLNIAVKGFGYTSPQAGAYYFSDGAAETLGATACGTWQFIAWLEEGKAPSVENPLPVTMDTSEPQRTVTALFNAPFSPDDFQTWLIEQDPEEVPDIGTYPQPGIATRETVDGHSIPDLVRLTMLYLCLTDANHPLHAEATAKYWNNLKLWHFWADRIAQADDSFAPPSLAAMRTYAAYCTVSGSLKDWAVAQFLAKHPGASDEPEDLAWAAQLGSVADLALDADPDADGFSNIDEWLFINWLTENDLASVQGWDPYSESPSFGAVLCLFAAADFPGCGAMAPNFFNTSGPNQPDTVMVTISADGNGVLSPGVGTYRVPTKKLSEYWLPNNYWETGAAVNDSAAAVPQFSVRAADTEDWQFRLWYYDPEPGLDPLLGVDECTGVGREASLTIPLDKDNDLRAVFDHRPGLAALNLPDALGQFLVAIGHLDDSAQVFGSEYDKGGIAYSGDTELYDGNGMPDIAEFALLDAILKNRALDLSQSGGVCHIDVWRAFQTNRELARSGLAGTPAAPDWLADVVAAYETLGSFGYDRFIHAAVQNLLGRDFPSGEYDTSASGRLAADRDADGDIVSNGEEWIFVDTDTSEMPHATLQVTQQIVNSFAVRVLNGEMSDCILPANPIPVVPSEGITTFPACFNDAGRPSGHLRRATDPYIPPTSVVAKAVAQGGDESGGTVSDSYRQADVSGPGLPFKAYVMLDSDGAGAVQIDPAALQSGADQPPITQGRVIRLILDEGAESDEVFCCWAVPETLADGSTDKSVMFTFDPPTGSSEFHVKAVRRTRKILTVPNPTDNANIVVTALGAYSTKVQPAGFGVYNKYYSVVMGTELVVYNALQDNSLLSFVGDDYPGVAYGRSASRSQRVVMPGFHMSVACCGAPCTSKPTSIRTARQPHAVSGLYFDGGLLLGFLDSISDCGDIYYGPYYGYPCSTGTCVRYTVQPEPGYYDTHGWRVGGSEEVTCSFPLVNGTKLASNATYPAADIQKGKALTATVAVDGVGGAQGGPNDQTAAAAGMVKASPAQHFHDGRTCWSPHGTVVRLNAVANCGYVFRGWKGTGEAYKSAVNAGNEQYTIYDRGTGNRVSLDNMQNSDNPATIYVEMDSDRQLTAIFVPQASVQLMEPNLDPITDNHYVFDSSTPGVCRVSPVASNDVPCAGYQWYLDPIDGATLTVSPDPPNVYDPVFTYTTLPSANSEFGDKTLTVSRAGGSEWTSRGVQIFYTGTVENHPEITNPINTLVAQHGPGCIPNWFYYWRQTSASFGQPLFCHGVHQGHTIWNTSVNPSRWEAHIGIQGNLYYHPSPDLLSAPTFYDETKRGSYQWAASGIDTFAWICRHEGNHVTAYNIWWPGGNDFSVGNSDGLLGDEIPDSYEITYGYDPYNGDSNGDHMGDGEDYVIRTQQSWVPFSAQDEDWSDDGQQSGIL